MISHLIAIAKEYAQGTNGKQRIKPAESTKAEEERLRASLKRISEQLHTITGSLSHNRTSISQLPYFKTYLSTKNFDSLFKEIFGPGIEKDLEETKKSLLDLVLYIKYEVQNPGSYASYIETEMISLVEKIGAPKSKTIIEALARSEETQGLSCFKLIEDYLSLNSLELVRNRYLFTGFKVGRKDGYHDRADGEDMVICNPDTMQEEKYVVKNIRAIREDTNQQELSLLGKMYIPRFKSSQPILYISWRGTKNTESTYSDLQISAGFESFLSHEAEILRQISETIDSLVQEQEGRPVTVFISGHSLGGALSQLTYHSIQRALCRGADANTSITMEYEVELMTELPVEYRHIVPGLLEESNRISINPKNVLRMHVVLFNATGVLHAVSNSSNACSQYLSSLESPVEQFGHFSLTHGDLVQCTGKSTILTPATNTSAQVELLYFQTKQAGMVAKAVTIPMFTYGGGVLGSCVVPGIGTTLGYVAGGAISTACVGYGLKKAHTYDYFNDHGQILRTSELKEAPHYFSSNGEADTAEIVSKLEKTKVTAGSINYILGVLSSFDLLGKRNPKSIREEKNSAEMGAEKCPANEQSPFKEEKAINSNSNQPTFFQHNAPNRDSAIYEYGEVPKAKPFSPLTFVVTCR